MKSEWNKHLEAARLILQFPQSHQVVNSMERFFQMAVQHRAVGPQTDFVSRLMDVQPSVRVGLMFAQLITDFRMEDFSTATRHASQARRTHIFQHPANGLLSLKFEPVDFDRRPSLEVNLR